MTTGGTKMPRTLDADGLVIEMPDTIYTYTGRMIRPLHPDQRDIDIHDIAHALSQQCRFTGHTTKFSSVAEHCIRVSWIVAETNPELQLEALLHDASEAYLSDIARPVKKAPGFGETYLKYEARLERAVAEHFGLPAREEMHPLIKAADQYALEAEVAALCHENLQAAMGVTFDADCMGEPWQKWAIPVGWNPKVSETMFLYTFEDAKNRRQS